MYTSIFQETMAEDNWEKIQKAGNKKTPVLFPIGVIEEHGPHLPLGADIYWSYAMCRKVKAKLDTLGKESVIAPPYYWGINHCTGSFPGTFSLKPQTMRQVMFEIFENLKAFSFTEIYCFNYHGDAAHTEAVADAVKRANAELGICVRLVVNVMDLELFGWRGDEDFLLVVNPDYPCEWFEEMDPSEAGLLDIHAGAFETAVLNYFCSPLVDLEAAGKLTSSSLNEEGLQKWLQGGETAKRAVPLGYAGNPAGHGAVGLHVEEMIDLQTEDIAKQIYHVCSHSPALAGT